MLLIIDIEEAEVEERLDAVRRRTRLWDEKEERVLRVDELGVDGLMREGTSAEYGEDNRPWQARAACREYG